MTLCCPQSLPTHNNASSNDPWGTFIQQCVNSCSSIDTPSRPSFISALDSVLAPPAKSNAPVQTNAESNDPWGTPIMQCVNVQRVPAFQEDMPSQQNVICFLDPWGTPPRMRAQIARTALVNLDTHPHAISSVVEIPVAQVLGTASPVVKGALVPAHISATRQLDMLGKHMQAAVVNQTADAPVTLRVDPVFPPPSCDEKKNHARSKPRTTPDSSTGLSRLSTNLR